MPSSTSSVHGLPRELVLDVDEDVELAMRRIDRREAEAVRRHLLGDLLHSNLLPAGSSAR